MIVEASDILSCVGTVNVFSEWDCRARQPGLARPGRRAERDSAATNLKLLQQIQNTATDTALSVDTHQMWLRTALAVLGLTH